MREQGSLNPKEAFNNAWIGIHKQGKLGPVAKFRHHNLRCNLGMSLSDEEIDSSEKWELFADVHTDKEYYLLKRYAPFQYFISAMYAAHDCIDRKLPVSEQLDIWRKNMRSIADAFDLSIPKIEECKL